MELEILYFSISFNYFYILYLGIFEVKGIRKYIKLYYDFIFKFWFIIRLWD